MRRRALGIWVVALLVAGAVAAIAASDPEAPLTTATDRRSLPEASTTTTSEAAVVTETTLGEPGTTQVPPALATESTTTEPVPDLPPPPPPPAGEPPPTGPPWTAAIEASGIHLVDLGTGQVRRITEPADNNPVPSPDGRRLTYIDGVPGTIEQHPAIVGIDGTGARRFPEGFRTGLWAPDSRHLLTASGGDDEALVIVDVDDPGAAPQFVATVPRLLGLALSPSGREIAWSSEGGTHVMNADGTNDRIVHPFLDDRREFWLQGWTPDGGELLFSVRDTFVEAREGSLIARGDNGVVAVSVSTGASRTIARTIDHPTYVAVSPDGTRVAYLAPARPEDIIFEAWTVDLSGASAPVATGEAGHELRWSPDSRELIALRPVSGSQDRELVAIDPGGGSRVVVPARPGQTFFNLRPVPGTGFAVVDAGTQAEWR